jgi:hypothetical protein
VPEQTCGLKSCTETNVEEYSRIIADEEARGDPFNVTEHPSETNAKGLAGTVTLSVSTYISKTSPATNVP